MRNRSFDPNDSHARVIARRRIRPKSLRAWDRVTGRLDPATPLRPGSWNPAPGDELVGVVIGWRRDRSPFGDTWPVLEVVQLGTNDAIDVWLIGSLRAAVHVSPLWPGQVVRFRRLENVEDELGVHRTYSVRIEREIGHATQARRAAS